MSVVWLTSYPKSGNTWVRFLLRSYFLGPVTTSDEVEAFAPDLHATPTDVLDETLREAASRPVVVKSHLLLTDQHPLLDQTLSAIYIIRHPKDVLLSNMNYSRLTCDRTLDALEYARRFIEVGGDPRWIDAGIGTWEEHARSWTSQERFPTMLVRYEDLHARPAEVLGQIVESLGETQDSQRLEAAVRASDFESMRQLEVTEKVSRRAPMVFGASNDLRGGVLFMNQGQVTGTLSHLDPELDALFDRRFGAALERFGYAAV